jgi:vancomycin permeability regulator SanA
MSRRAKPKKRRNWILRAALVLLLVAAVAAGVWCHWVYVQIETYASLDQAAASDAICVFGAAEYDGRPSPVYRARLDHALALYKRGIAPLIITLGGAGGDEYSEGAVGREYLMGMGVPEGPSLPRP